MRVSDTQSTAKAFSSSPTPANANTMKVNNKSDKKRVSIAQTSAPSKIVKTKGGTNSAGAAKRASNHQSEDSKKSDSNSDEGDTINVAQPIKKKKSGVQVAINRSPASTLVDSPPKLAMRGKSEGKRLFSTLSCRTLTKIFRDYEGFPESWC